MSYNVDLKVNRCEHCKRSDDVEGWHWNYTSNMVPAWRSAGADLAAFDGKKARECAQVLRAAIDNMTARPGFFERFNAPNGWGSMHTLLPALRTLLRGMEENPDALVEVSR
jgi:hypothetical protein